jgi:hypothetical protein
MSQHEWLHCDLFRSGGRVVQAKNTFSFWLVMIPKPYS